MPKWPDTHWVFLRGLSRCEAHWGQFREQFAQTISPHIKCLEIPGNGTRYRERSPTRYPELLHDLKTQYAKLGGPKRWGLGISLGGMSLFQWVAAEPELFHGVIVINISLPRINAFRERVSFRQLRTLLPLTLPVSAAYKENCIFELTSSRPELKSRVLKSWIEIEKKFPIQKRNFWAQIFLARSFDPPATLPAVPILMLNSAGDRLVNPVCSKKISRYYQLPLEVHPSAGHDLPLDDPNWVIQKVDDFLQRRGIAASGPWPS